ncbi:Uncharacterized protein dnm_079600 [Desulfonema magnum]|uniref:Uncharacterized protein n=1 Tax=Desulfonema magnum TaxID=45655 RepID=A0A975GSB1_9BACT|nr:Uncharacterized protein dnm_079600 [Desulfonema magnum]
MRKINLYMKNIYDVNSRLLKRKSNFFLDTSVFFILNNRILYKQE